VEIKNFFLTLKPYPSLHVTYDHTPYHTHPSKLHAQSPPSHLQQSLDHANSFVRAAHATPAHSSPAAAQSHTPNCSILYTHPFELCVPLTLLCTLGANVSPGYPSSAQSYASHDHTATASYLFFLLHLPPPSLLSHQTSLIIHIYLFFPPHLPQSLYSVASLSQP